MKSIENILETILIVLIIVGSSVALIFSIYALVLLWKTILGIT